eukprot:1026592_1
MTETQNVATYARIRPYNPAINEDKRLTARASQGNKILNQNGANEDTYNFTGVFDMSENTEDVFQNAMKPLLDYKILQGINSIFIVYGQSGSGKSFTLIGEPGHLGVLPMSLQYLLEQDNVESIHVASIEAYGIKAAKIGFYDLVSQLKEKKANKKKFDPYASKDNSRLDSSNAQRIQITKSNCLKVITSLQEVSHMAPTLKNPHSSRGHTVYFNQVKMKGLEDVYFIAVDLAGSEGQTALGTKDEFVNGLKLAMSKGKLKLNKRQMKGFEEMYKTRSLEAGCINNGFTQRQTIFILSILGASANNNKVTVIEQMNPWKCVPRISKQPIITRATLNFAKQTQLVKFDTYTQRASAKIHKKDATIKALNAMIMQRFMLQSVNTMDIAPFLGAWSDDDLTWLNISKLLNELEEHQWISNHALQLITEAVFSNTKAFIATLWEHNHLTCRQLNTIYNTLKNTMLHNPLNTVSHSKTVSSFAALSIPSITNICSYLTMSDILSFKNTSINIAIIALHEMSKYHIGVFNMNQLFHHFNNFSVLKHIKTCDVIQSERYPPSMTFKKIIEVWSKHYDINPRNMVLLYNQSTCARYGRDDWGMGMELKMGWSGSPVSLDSSLRKPLIQFMLGEGASKCSVMTKQRDISDFRIKQMERDRFDYFFVLDKTKMSVIYDIEQENKYNDEDPYATSGEVIYDRSTEWSCSSCTFINRLSHKVCEMCGSGMSSVPDGPKFNVLMKRHEQQCLILLSYFDLKRQKISFCRSLIVHKTMALNDLKGYIANNIQLWVTEWDDEVSQLLNCMKSYNVAHNIKGSIVDLHRYTNTNKTISTTSHGLTIYPPNAYSLVHCDDHLKTHENVLRERVEMYVFQLNPSHHLMSMNADNYISKLRIYYDQILNESFWANPNALTNDIYKELKWKNNELIPDFGGYRTTLSPFLVTHVCSYLNNADIKSLKMVSSGTAMLCLKEMRKIKIKSIYMSNIERNNLMTLKDTTVKQLINYTRIHKDSTMNSLRNVWCQQYNIPNSELLIYSSHSSCGDLDGTKALQLLCDTNIEIWDSSTVLLKAKIVQIERIFLIFDKRKLFKLNPFIRVKDVHNHKTILLNYFNFVTHDVSSCNPLIVPHNQCTIHDIEAFLIRNASKLLSDGTNETMHRMQTMNSKQNIFKFTTIYLNEDNEMQCKRIKTIGSQWMSNIMFQINDEHDLFTKKRKFNANKHIASPQVLFFQHELITFRYVSNGLRLDQCIQYFMDQSYDWAAKLIKQNAQSCVTLKITPNMKGNAISKLISNRFKMIPFRQIQVLSTQNKPIKWNESLIDVGVFQWNKNDEQYCVRAAKDDTKILKVTELLWTVIPMCWIRPRYDKMVMYNINVYTPNNEDLQTYETTLPATAHQFFVPFKKKFVAKELIDYLNSVCNGIYRERSKSVLKYFGGDGDIFKDKYSFLISAYSGCTKELMENCYEYDAIIKYKVNIGNKISIFIVHNRKYRNMNNCTEEEHPVIIRFKEKQNKNDSMSDYHKHIGRPKRIWINKSALLSRVGMHSPHSLVMYNGFLSLINVKAYCFSNQISPPVSTKRLLKNDSNLYQAIFKKQMKRNINTNINHVLLVTVT